MQYIVAFSGGHSSALVAIEAVRKYGKENVILLNHDISSKVEHQSIKRFKDDISHYLDIPITYANMDNFEEMTPIEVCRRRGAFTNPITQQALCTYYLKTQPFNKYLDEFYPSNFENPRSDIKILYGFDAGELSRIQRRIGVLGNRGYYTDYPLAFWDRTISKIEDIGIERPVTYRIFKHANCIGCLKAGMQHWYCVFCLRPDLFYEAVKLENELGHSIIKNHFLEDLIPRFAAIKSKGICPSEKDKAGTFWANVNSVLPEQTSLLPCDCAVL